ncbi:MAG: helix-turn-helix transcriptional regulator [Actinomycetota bacterium]|nr:helix-turn-helix transcriptional regulator [Actinomycetota bacterium]
MADWSVVARSEDVNRIPELVYGIPDPRLAGLVLTYTAHDHTHPEPLPWRVVALAAVTVTIDLETPQRALPSGGSFPNSPVIGMRDRPLEISQGGRACGITIGLTPSGAHALFGPLWDFTNTSVGLADLVGGSIIDQVASEIGWAARFRLLDSWLGPRIATGHELMPPVLGALAGLAASAGRVRIGDLADDVGWTRQHLVSRFRRQVGLTPKTMARVIRLHRAVSLMTGTMTLGDIAHTCGYADQSHLNRDFRALTGSVPGEVGGQVPFVSA